MNKQLLKLQQDIIEGGNKHCRYDRYAFNAFASSAQHFSYQAQNDEEKALCLWLKELALKKAKDLA